MIKTERPKRLAPKASELLASAVASGRAGGLTIRALLDALGNRAHGMALLAFGLPNSLPMPPGIPTVSGVVILLVSLQLIFTPRRLWLPNFLGRRDLPAKAVVWHVVFTSILFLAGTYGIYNYALNRGYDLELARTLCVNTLIVLELFYLFFIRNYHTTSLTWEAARGTPAVWISVGIVIVGQILLTYAPPFQAAFETRPVSLLDGALVIGIGVVFFAISEMEKQLRLRLAGSNGKNSEVRPGTTRS